MSKRARSVVGGVVILATTWAAAGCSGDASNQPEPLLPARVSIPGDETLAQTQAQAQAHEEANPTGQAPTTTAPPPSPHADRLPRFAAAPSPAQRMALAPGPAAHLSRIDTADPVAFVTIDDGYVRHPEALALIRDSKVPVSLFLISSVAAQDPKFFSDISEQTGAVIQAHSVSHARLRGLPYEAQRREICGSADQLEQLFGTRPTLFRAPGGLQDATTLRVAAECGMRAVMFWREAVNDGRVQFQEGSRIQPGDVILMHFRPTFVEDYLAALRGIKDAGLTPARLEDYL